MPAWLTRALRRIRALAIARQVSFTLKAVREIAELGLDPDDACEVLSRLTAEDCSGRRKSTKSGEWMYVFKPATFGTVLYIKVVLRTNCVVISFHDDEDAAYEEDDQES